MQENKCEELPDAMPALFLQLDLNGDGKISREEMRAGYKRFARDAGVRARDSVAPKSPSEMSDLDTQAQGYLTPKVAGLEAVFAVLTLAKPGAPPEGQVLSVRKLRAFQTALENSAQKELLAAQEAFAAANTPAGKKEAEAAGLPPPVPPPTKIDAKTQKLLDLDLEALFEDAYGKSAVKNADGDLELDFTACKSLLARHAAALAGGGGGGGKKGKKKK